VKLDGVPTQSMRRAKNDENNESYAGWRGVRRVACGHRSCGPSFKPVNFVEDFFQRTGSEHYGQESRKIHQEGQARLQRPEFLQGQGRLQVQRQRLQGQELLQG
jgi:hypothetical protein